MNLNDLTPTQKVAGIAVAAIIGLALLVAIFS